MTQVATQIDQLMEQASQKLVATDYLACESLCMQAIELARQIRDYPLIARILMPLQEARRQRRQIAEDTGTFVVTGKHRDADAILDEHSTGCLLLTDPPYTDADADALRTAARGRGCMVEVLCLDATELTAAFCEAMQRHGDAAVARATAIPAGPDRVDTLLAELDCIGDHEIAHQRLAQAAREVNSPTA